MHRRSHAALTASALLFLALFLLQPNAVPHPHAVPPTETPVPPSPTPVPTATATPVPAPARAAYTINAVMDYNAKTVAVEQTIVYPNHSGQPLTDLVLAVVPNFWLGGFTLGSLSVDGTPITNYTLEGQKLTVPLPTTFHPETTITSRPAVLAGAAADRAHRSRPLAAAHLRLQRTADQPDQLVSLRRPAHQWRVGAARSVGLRRAPRLRRGRLHGQPQAGGSVRDAGDRRQRRAVPERRVDHLHADLRPHLCHLCQHRVPQQQRAGGPRDRHQLLSAAAVRGLRHRRH